MAKDDLWVLALGFVGLWILSEASKPKCPSCKQKVTKGVESCPHCGSYLQWRN